MRTSRALLLAGLCTLLGACGESVGLSGDSSPYCEHGQSFEYIFNGRLAHDAESSALNVSAFDEVIVYVETPDNECDGGNYSEIVDLLFRLDESSPWGRTGQLFDFESSGGRFSVDGRFLKLEARCDVVFQFEYSVAGVTCADG